MRRPARYEGVAGVVGQSPHDADERSAVPRGDDDIGVAQHPLNALEVVERPVEVAVAQELAHLGTLGVSSVE